MKANPMKTAPKDGRWIVCLRSDLDPMRVKWSHVRWINSFGAQWSGESFIGWVEDIEPPEPEIPKDLELQSVEFHRFDDGSMTIKAHGTTKLYPLSPSEVAVLFEWLKQWH